MKFPRRLAVALLLLLAVVLIWRITSRDNEFTSAVPSRRLIEASPLCPWRQPSKDMAAFFPGATRYSTETLILTGHYREFKKRLGRLPTPDENPLYLHRVFADSRQVGQVLVRRVKGEFGAIELVIAFDSARQLKGVHIQRIREPEATKKALDGAWLTSFQAKTSDAKWHLGQDIPAVPPSAAQSARAIIDSVRSSLILYKVGVK